MPWFRARGTLAAVVCVLSVGCEQAVLSLGNTPDEARGRADELLGALAARFGPLEREPAFLERRPRLARAALAPSRAFADRSLWTAAEGDWRRLEFSGTSRGGRYRIGVGARAPTPARPGEYRADVRLRALGPGEFEWQGHDELAVGTVTIADVDRALTALLAAAEQISGADAAAR